MKHIFLCFLLYSVMTQAQEKKPYEMMVNDVKVVVVPTGNEIIQMNLVIKGGLQNY